MYASTNFLSKSAFAKAVVAGKPIILYSPTMLIPAINGMERVEGPWPGTKPPVELIPDTGHSANGIVVNDAQGRRMRMKPRECVMPWHAEVRVEDMRVVEVMSS
jgi:hypothetical protein